MNSSLHYPCSQAEFIIEFVNKALNNNVKSYDSSSGAVKQYGTSYEDLGDYLPALLFYGKQEIVDREVNNTINELRRSEFVFTKEQPGIKGCLARAYDQSDLIWGLQLAARHDRSLNEVVNQALDEFWNSFWAEGGTMMRLSRVPYLNLRVPKQIQPTLKVLSAEDHGMFIELYAHQYMASGEIRHLERALEIYKTFVRTQLFIDRNTFPFYTTTDKVAQFAINKLRGFNKRSTQFQLLKQNSNTLWGIFKLNEAKPEDQSISKLIQETLDKWLHLYLIRDTGVFCTNYEFSSGRKGADLTCFHMIELLVESARRFGRTDHLDQASIIADSFIKYQSSTTGLVPFLHPSIPHEIPRFGIKGGLSWLDSTVDFAIAILKLGLLSGDSERVAQFDKILDGVTRHHRQPYGYASSVSVSDGALDNPVYSTKMTALVLKLFIAKADMSNIFNTESDTHFALLDR